MDFLGARATTTGSPALRRMAGLEAMTASLLRLPRSPDRPYAGADAESERIDDDLEEGRRLRALTAWPTTRPPSEWPLTTPRTVVESAPVRVGKNLVGLLDFHEALCRVSPARDVWMVSPGEAAIGRLDRLFIRVRSDVQSLVIILHRDQHPVTPDLRRRSVSDALHRTAATDLLSHCDLSALRAAEPRHLSPPRARSVRGDAHRRCQSRSIMVAMPWPKPMHMVCSP